MKTTKSIAARRSTHSMKSTATKNGKAVKVRRVKGAELGQKNKPFDDISGALLTPESATTTKGAE